MNKTEWQEWKDEHRGNYTDLINFANSNGAGDAVSELISTNDIDSLVADRVQSTSWCSVYHLLSGIADDMNSEYYQFDGYGNLESVDDWDTVADNVEDCMEFDEYICDVCGKTTDTLYSVGEWVENDETLTEEEKEYLNSELDDGFDRCPTCWTDFKILGKAYFHYSKDWDEEFGADPNRENDKSPWSEFEEADYDIQAAAVEKYCTAEEFETWKSLTKTEE